jgi:hypothetical protein
LNKREKERAMPPGNFKRRWIKLFIDECLTGTIREDLTPEERSVWYDFLLLAGRNRPPGCISANENTPISSKRIAAILNITETLVRKCILNFEKSGRIRVRPNRVIYIVNWDHYQFTDYDRQKPFRQKPQEQPDKDSSFDQYKEELRPQYPDLDIDHELIGFNLWWSEGDRKLKRPKSAFLNWLNKAREIKKQGREPREHRQHAETTDEERRLSADKSQPLG